MDGALGGGAMPWKEPEQDGIFRAGHLDQWKRVGLTGEGGLVNGGEGGYCRKGSVMGNAFHLGIDFCGTALLGLVNSVVTRPKAT